MKAALYRLSEFLEIKKRLLDIRENARGAIKTTDKDIAKTALIAKGFREAGQTAANTFRTFADKPEVDYSQKEQKHPITKAVLAPMKAVKKMLVSMPSYKTKQVDEQSKPIYQDVCYPVTKDFREKLYNEIISEYEKAKDKSNENARESAEKHHGNPDKEKDKEATPFR